MAWSVIFIDELRFLVLIENSFLLFCQPQHFYSFLHMQNYYCVSIQIPPGDQRDELIAAISVWILEGFEETESTLKVWFNENDFPDESLNVLLQAHHINFEKQFIKGKNWNAEWEANFQPVIIDKKISIRANFHKPIPGMMHEIIITPKMSFGTGHHATTALMISEMLRIDFHHKKVFDFGAGTGILSILAEKLGAKEIYSIDNDSLSSENFLENIHANQCANIFYTEKSTPPENELFDMILANINKHVLMEFMPHFSQILNKKGQLLISGIFTTDVDDLIQEAAKWDLAHRITNVKDSWALIAFYAF